MLLHALGTFSKLVNLGRKIDFDVLEAYFYKVFRFRQTTNSRADLENLMEKDVA